MLSEIAAIGNTRLAPVRALRHVAWFRVSGFSPVNPIPSIPSKACGLSRFRIRQCPRLNILVEIPSWLCITFFVGREHLLGGYRKSRRCVARCRKIIHLLDPYLWVHVIAKVEHLPFAMVLRVWFPKSILKLPRNYHGTPSPPPPEMQGGRSTPLNLQSTEC